MTNAPSTPAAITATHRGIEYPGELLRVPAWVPSLGEPLTGDVYFRVVFLESPSSVFPRSIHDHRIAIYAPGPRSQALERAEVELRVMREAMGTYGSDSQSLDLLESESDAIEQRAVRVWAESFPGGQLIAAPALDADLDRIFGDGYWSTWAERIGALLLDRAYVDTPVMHELLRTAVRPQVDAPILLDALTGNGDETATFAMDSFGPALGLKALGTDEGQPTVVQRIAEMAADGWAPDAIGHALAHEQGITYPLATLYLLLWVRNGHHSLRLRPGHGLLLRDGQRLAQDVIGGKDLPALRWPLGLWARIEALDLTESPAAVDAHLAALAGPVGQNESLELAAERLLTELRDDLPGVMLALGRLAIAQGDNRLPRQASELQRIAESDSVATAIADAKRALPDASLFASLLRLWRGWAGGDEQAVRLTHEIDWLRSAIIDEDAGDLFTEREALVSRIHARALLATPHEWAPLAETVRVFEDRYARAYLDHHQEHHAEVDRLAHTIDATWRKAKALDRLNEIVELGGAVGAGLLGLAEEIRNTVVACGQDRTPDDVLQAPICPTCGMHLGAPTPGREAAHLGSYVDEALGEQNRRLATRVAHQIIERPEQGDLDTFIQVVQISDLSGLANVLDDRVVSFIRSLLQPDAGGPHNG